MIVCPHNLTALRALWLYPGVRTNIQPPSQGGTTYYSRARSKGWTSGARFRGARWTSEPGACWVEMLRLSALICQHNVSGNGCKRPRLVLCIAMPESYLHDVPVFTCPSLCIFSEIWRQVCLVWVWLCRRDRAWRCCSQGPRSASTSQLLGLDDQFGWRICKFWRGLTA